MNQKILFGALASVSLVAGCGSNSSSSGHGDMAHSGPLMNYHRINSTLATGGHVTDDDSISALVDQGVTLVIDLRDEPPEGHKERLAAAGIRWENVPVVWSDPKQEDFAAFSELMTANADENILVQCQANYRASAMTYAFRVTDGVPEAEARKDLEAIWTLEGTWETYIGDILSTE